MKNAELKIKNESEDGKFGNKESSTLAGCLRRGSGADAQVQGLKFKPQSWGGEVAGGAKFEEVRLKSTFRVGGHREGWTPNGEGNLND